MKRFSIVCGLILASTVLPVKVLAATFSQLVVYGDSLSDLGRASALTGGAAPPYSALTNGRFSNGPLWVEYLATSLGIFPTPINPPSAINATNFAVGGATTGTGNTVVAPLGGIQDQVSIGSISDPNALYIIWGGANDYLGGGITNPGVPVGNLSAQISTLISRGATNILVPNLPDLGALPVTRNLGQTSSNLTALTQAHNGGLATSLNLLGQANPGVKLTLLDVNSLFNQAVTSPSSFGFTDVTTQCITINSLCTTPDSFLFWDDIHPTTAGHQLIGNLAFNAIVPEPTTILGSILAGGAIIAFKRQLKSSQLNRKSRSKVLK